MAWITLVDEKGKELKIPHGAYDMYYKGNSLFTIKDDKKKANISEEVSKPSSNINENKEKVEDAKVNGEVTRSVIRKSPKKDSVQ